MKEILVLGGGGFIGRNIVSSLLSSNDCVVTAADIQEGSNWSELAISTKDRFKPVIDDFTDMQAFHRLNQNFDEIYMLAAVVGVNRTLEHPEEVIRINSLLTMNTLDFISRNPINKLLFSSSSENYAGTSDLFNIEIPTPESVALCIEDVKHPRWTYAITKMHGELAFFHSAKSHNYKCVIVRYQNIIGPEMGFGTLYLIFLKDFLRRKNPLLKYMDTIKQERFVISTMLLKELLGQWNQKNLLVKFIISEWMMK